MKKTILLLAANPANTSRLRLDKEVREISNMFRRSRLRHQFEIEQRWAVQPRDVQRAILELKPHIVHFSGHGEGEAGLVFEDAMGQARLVSSEAISSIFRLVASRVECVLMNACYAEVQADVIVQHINYVIGMSSAVRDDVAIAFATGFYSGMGDGLSVEQAFEKGKESIQTLFSGRGEERKLVPVDQLKHTADTSPPDHLIPVLKRKENLQSLPLKIEPPQ